MWTDGPRAAGSGLSAGTNTGAPGDQPGAGRRETGAKWSRRVPLVLLAGALVLAVAALAAAGWRPGGRRAGSEAATGAAAPPAGGGQGAVANSTTQAGAATPRRTSLRVLARIPHDPSCYTQGLLWSDGRLYESCGQYGASSLREVDPQTGAVLRRRDLAARYFGEGLALVGDRLVQLTWREEEALVWRRADFAPAESLRYRGEGWGLCRDGGRLVQSDGSSRLTFRDAASFAVTGTVEVTLEGRSIHHLNELECVAGVVWANVWQTNWILRIEPADGRVTAVVDAAGLLTAAEQAAGAEVLNGIAWDGERQRLLVTGKYWPWMFVVEPDPAI